MCARVTAVGCLAVCPAGEPPSPFFTLLTTSMLTATDHGADVRILVAYLLFIATMVHGHPASAVAFLSEGANLQFVCCHGRRRVNRDDHEGATQA